MAGVNIVNVPYKGGAQTLAAAIGGEVQLTIYDAGVIAPHIKSGKLRALAVTSAQPSALAPGLPPVAAAVPGYESISMTGIFAPAKTPAAIINRLNQEIVRYLKTTEARETLLKRGAETVGSNPEQLATRMAAEIARLDKLIKAIGLRAD
jgi:tripartite-type tricarboxylate transporter receptor subunit TctC